MESPEERIERLEGDINTDHNLPESLPVVPATPTTENAPVVVEPLKEAIIEQTPPPVVPATTPMAETKPTTPATPATPETTTAKVDKDYTMLWIAVIGLLAVAGAFYLVNLKKKKDGENTFDLNGNQFQDMGSV